MIFYLARHYIGILWEPINTRLRAISDFLCHHHVINNIMVRNIFSTKDNTEVRRNSEIENWCITLKTKGMCWNNFFSKKRQTIKTSKQENFKRQTIILKLQTKHYIFWNFDKQIRNTRHTRLLIKCLILCPSFLHATSISNSILKLAMTQVSLNLDQIISTWQTRYG